MVNNSQEMKSEILDMEDVQDMNEIEISKFETIQMIRTNINIAIAERYNVQEAEFDIFRLDCIVQNKNCRVNLQYQENERFSSEENLKRY